MPMCAAELQERSQLRARSAVFSQEEGADSLDKLRQGVLDHFRCPEDFLHWTLNGDLNSGAEYFRFGTDVLCYGRTCLGSVESRLPSSPIDVANQTVLDQGRVGLPFDPNEIIDNLRLERYLHRPSSGFESALKKIYYWLRPLTNQAMRKRIKKFHARDWQELLFPHWPVDTTVENLCESLLLRSLQAQGVDRVPFVWFWPRGARGCVMMTHDVETEAGRDFCTQLLDMNDAFGIKSSLQIVPEGRYAVPPRLLEMIRARGCEVGIQDLNHDGRLFDNRDEFQRRAARINRYGRNYGAKGFRAAVLYRNPEWFDQLDFSFDMSMPNVAPLDPQRGGCCTVMPYFIGKILELPVTTVQDYTLFHLLNERSIALWQTQVELILKKHGLASFIVHPDYIQERDTRTVYEALLRYLGDLRETTSLWFALPREVDSWWRARSQMSVTRDGNSWRIEGAGAEQATLAFAKNVNGKLVYDLTPVSAASANLRVQ